MGGEDGADGVGAAGLVDLGSAAGVGDDDLRRVVVGDVGRDGCRPGDLHAVDDQPGEVRVGEPWCGGLGAHLERTGVRGGLVEVVVEGPYVDRLGDVPVRRGEPELGESEEIVAAGPQPHLLIADPRVDDGVDVDEHRRVDRRPAKHDADRVGGAGALVDVQR